MTLLEGLGAWHIGVMFHGFVPYFCIMIIFSLLLLLIAFNHASMHQLTDFPTKDFSSIYEPSGIVNVGAGQFLLIEDEPERPIHQLKFDTNGGLMETGQVPIVGSKLRLNDLEGISFDGQYIYLITSHAVTKKNKKGNNRRALLRLEYQNGRLSKANMFRGLHALVKAQLAPFFTGLSDEQLGKLIDIEALSWLPARDKKPEALLIGLRKPLIDGKSVVLTLHDLDAVFNPQTGSESLSETAGQAAKNINMAKLSMAQIDLHGQGIRAMQWDTQQQRFLIVSGNSERRLSEIKPHLLWSWQGKVVKKIGELPYQTEGFALLDSKVDAGVKSFSAIVVIDNGDQALNKFGQYQFVPNFAPKDYN